MSGYKLIIEILSVPIAVQNKVIKIKNVIFFAGLGYSTLLVITFVSIYYMLIIAWVLFYLYTSFFPSMTWGRCDNDWNTESES